MRARCKLCDMVYSLGEGHVCKPQGAVKLKPAETVPLPVAHASPKASPKFDASPKTSPKVIEMASPKRGAARNYRWRDTNRERYNAYMRGLMQKRWRAAKAIESAKAG